MDFAKAQGNILCDALLQTGKTHFAAIEKLYKHLEEVNTTIQIKGRGFYSTAQLDACEEEWGRAERGRVGSLVAVGPLPGADTAL